MTESHEIEASAEHSVGSRVVGLVDDDPSMSKALQRLLRTEGYEVHAFTTAEECLSALEEFEPDCLLVDLDLPGLDGLGLQRALVERDIELEVVFLTGYGDVPSSVEALKSGAVDFLEKPVDRKRLLAALDVAIERHVAWHREHETYDILSAALGSLTPREREVLEEVVSGRLNKQIARRLGITEGTVKVHRRRVMRKMKAASLADLVRMASRLGIPSQSVE